jgi:hypothetical protein
MSTEALRAHARQLLGEANCRMDGPLMKERINHIAAHLVEVDAGYSPTTGQKLTKIVPANADGTARTMPGIDGRPVDYPGQRLLEELATKFSGLLSH